MEQLSAKGKARERFLFSSDGKVPDTEGRALSGMMVELECAADVYPRGRLTLCVSPTQDWTLAYCRS